jgi:hypothetical protein
MWVATTALVVSALRPRTVYVYGTPTVYYYYPSTHVWYVKETNNGQEGYTVVSPPPNYELEKLPPDAEEVTVEDETYYFSRVESTFYTDIQRDGKTVYVIVDAPLGALVDALPKGAIEHEEDGETVYQYGDTFYVKETDESGKTCWVVTAPPASEVVDAETLPEDTVTMEVDKKEYFYMDGAFYARDRESGDNVYAVEEPPIGGKMASLPDGSMVLNESGRTYYQFDAIFMADDPGGGYVIVEEPK